VKRTEDVSDQQRTTIGLFNKKANLGPLSPAVAFAVRFSDDRTAFTRVSVADVGELAASLPLWQRMKAALLHGPRTLAALAEELRAKLDTVDRTVRRKDGSFGRLASSPGNRPRWLSFNGRPHDPDTCPVCCPICPVGSRTDNPPL
jgi:hypothetical protein